MQMHKEEIFFFQNSLLSPFLRPLSPPVFYKTNSLQGSRDMLLRLYNKTREGGKEKVWAVTGG
jgi:hypothetical protein